MVLPVFNKCEAWKISLKNSKAFFWHQMPVKKQYLEDFGVNESQTYGLNFPQNMHS